MSYDNLIAVRILEFSGGLTAANTLRKNNSYHLLMACPVLDIVIMKERNPIVNIIRFV